MGIGLGSDVTVIDKNMSRLSYLDEIFGSRLKTCYATLESIEEFAVEADVVVEQFWSKVYISIVVELQSQKQAGFSNC